MVLQQDSSDPTGVVAEYEDKAAIRARDRKANAALQLKVNGASWEDIAAVIGYPTPRAALVAVERALEKEVREESQAALRQLASRRLDRLLRSVMPKAIDPSNPEHLPAVGKAREIINDWVKLHGAAAPAEIAVYSPAQDELQNWVASVVKQERPQLEEADIFDVDFEEEEETSAVPAERVQGEDSVRDLG